MKFKEVNFYEYVDSREDVARFKNALIEKIVTKILPKLVVKDSIEVRKIKVAISDCVDEFVACLSAEYRVDLEILKLHKEHIYIDAAHRLAHSMAQEISKQNEIVVTTREDLYRTVNFRASVCFLKNGINK